MENSDLVEIIILAYQRGTKSPSVASMDFYLKECKDVIERQKQAIDAQNEILNALLMDKDNG